MFVAPRSSRPALLLVLGALLLGTPGCKSVLWQDVDEMPRTPAEQAALKRIFLGIVVKKQTPGDAGGVRVERVLRDSPADNAKLKPGDEISGISGLPVTSADELDKALQEQFDNAEVDLLVASGGVERTVRVRVRIYESYYKLAKTRTDAYARANDNRVPAIPFYDYRRCEVPVNMWLEYWGERMTKPVVLYEDKDYMPILNFWSAYRIETTDRLNGKREQYLFEPWVYTETEPGRRSTANLEAGEADYRKL